MNKAKKLIPLFMILILGFVFVMIPRTINDLHKVVPLFQKIYQPTINKGNPIVDITYDSELVTLIYSNGKKETMNKSLFVGKIFSLLILHSNGVIEDIRYNPEIKNKVTVPITNSGKNTFLKNKVRIEKTLSNSIHGYLYLSGYVGKNETIYFVFTDEEGNILEVYKSEKTTKTLPNS